MDSPKHRPRGRPAGGSEDLVRTILDRALDELVARGYSAMRVEEVARAAGVNKTSVYRRWPTKADLVLAALTASRSRSPAPRATGDLRGDLADLLRRKAQNLSTPRGRAIGDALFRIGEDADEGFAARLRAERYRLPTELFGAAVERGELPRTTDVGFASEMLIGPVVHRLLVSRDPVDEAFIARVVSAVLAAMGWKPAKARGKAASAKAT